MDQYTRKIIGFSVNEGCMSGGSICFMFNKIIAGKNPPKYLSPDNDPLSEYWLWKSNLEQYEIDEIKTVPHCPWSHPFIERKIGSCRREFFDQTLVYSKLDIESKFSTYADYFNKYRVHSALNGQTPNEKNGTRDLETIDLENYRWKSASCLLSPSRVSLPHRFGRHETRAARRKGMYQTPIAA